MNRNSSILIVEDELITATGLAELLEEEDYTIAGIAPDAERALQLCADAGEPPAVALCDIQLRSGRSGIELAAELKEKYGCEIVFLTAFADTKTLDAAFAHEPVMYVVKPFSDMQVRVAVQMAFHKVYKRRHIAAQYPISLTKREAEIAGLVAQGLSSRQVAERLFISEETVKTHRRRMLQKNNLTSFAQLVYLLNR